MPDINHDFYSSPLGKIILIAAGNALAGAYFSGEKYFRMPENSVRHAAHPAIRQAASWLDNYFAGERPSAANLPLAPQGSEFRMLVWSLLREIPYGACVSYQALAQKTARISGKKNMACQAVGGAVGHNPLSIFIPCHRVIAKNGELTGYSAGIEIKRKLLEHEGFYSIPGNFRRLGTCFHEG